MTKSPNRILTEEEFIASVEALLAAGRLEEARGMMADHLEARPSADKPFAVELRLKHAERVATPAEADLGLGVLNWLSRRLRNAEYHAKVNGAGFKGLRVLVEGDSWVEYPFLLADLFDHVARQPGFAAMSLAAAGDTAETMAHESEYRAAILRERPDVMILSLGGNDLLGDGQLASVLRKHRPGAGAGELIDWPALEARISAVIGNCRNIIQGALALSPDLVILGHGYDDPRPVKGGKWLGKPLADKGISMAQGQDVVARILARYNEALRALSLEMGGRFRYLNLRGTVGTAAQSWHDELHPKSNGFERAAAPVLTVLDAILAARRPGAGGQPVEALIADVPPPLDEATNLQLTAILRGRNLARRAGHAGGEGRPVVLRSDWPEGQLGALRDAWGDLEHLLDRLDEPDTPARTRARTELSLLPVDGVDERILGDSDLDEFNTLTRGARAGRAVGKVMIRMADGRKGSGSGFLVGPGLFLTNNHVLPDAHVAANSEIFMDYQLDADGIPQAPVRFRITDDLFLTDAYLDYTFVSVAAESLTGEALSTYGQLPLLAPSGKALKHERVSIIQHPRGVYKKVALRDNFVLGPAREFLYYTTDTQRGSSGAPVFNLEWQVAALHHRAVPSKTDPTRFIANRGVRISAILRHLAVRSAAGEPVATRVEDLLARGRAAGVVGDIAGERGAAMGSGHGGSGAPDLSGPEGHDLADHGSEGAGDDTLLVEGPFAGLTVAEALSALGHRWQAGQGGSGAPEAGCVSSEQAGLCFTPAAARAKLSERGYWQLVDHQTGGRAFYERITGAAPCWPGGMAGVTIGFGYDLGWVDRARFHADWGGLLTATQLGRLEAVLGVRGAAARALAEGLADIRIPFDEAKRVFDARCLPRLVAATWAALPTDALEALGADGISALVSLGLSRGPTWNRDGDRYREMRAIRAALAEGRLNDVPYQIRAMKRLDRGTGLARRRDDEAKLFRDCLARPVEAMEVIAPRSVAEPARLRHPDPCHADPLGEPVEGPPQPLPVSGPEQGADLGLVDSEEGFSEGLDIDMCMESSPRIALDLDLAEEGIMAPRLGVEHARWASPANHPDQRHLPAEMADAPFTLTAEVVQGLIELGDYAPVIGTHGKLILGLRGCRLVDPVGKAEDQAEIRLAPAIPDHERFRCLIGVVDMGTGRISLYPGSTVPRRTGMLGHYNARHFADRAAPCNMLPTGCYEYCVGTHRSQSLGAVSHVLRLGNGPEPGDRSAATVLRTAGDLIYGIDDQWDHTRPGDNIHPAFLANSFSSLGSLTVEGSQHGFNAPVATATGAWADFRRAAGFDGQNYAQRYDLLLVTGHEAASVAAGQAVPCLRHGSQGARVRHLQKVLGLRQDGRFGPATRKALADRQRAELGHATGAWSPDVARAMGISFQP